MNEKVTEIIFLFDRSGSMGGLEKETIGGFNAFVEKQANFEGETIVTTVLFDDKYEILSNGVNAKKLSPLSDKEYFVRGCTALLDAVGKTILDVGYRLSQTSVEQIPGKVIFVVTTDGLENASREFTYQKVKELIQHQQEKYSWQFIFLGANIDAAKEAESLGINRDNAFNYEASKVGVGAMYMKVCEEVASYRGNDGKKKV